MVFIYLSEKGCTECLSASSGRRSGLAQMPGCRVRPGVCCLTEIPSRSYPKGVQPVTRLLPGAQPLTLGITRVVEPVSSSESIIFIISITTNPNSTIYSLFCGPSIAIKSLHIQFFYEILIKVISLTYVASERRR